MKHSTALIHHPYKAPQDFEAPQIGVFKASTVYFPNVAAMRSREWKDKSAYTYGLHGTPTTFTLEERLCSLEGGLQCLLVPSGLAAIANTALALLGTGDEVLLPDNAYGPNKTLCEGELAQYGIVTRFYQPMDVAHLASLINERTRLVWLEAPGSVTLEFPDLIAQVQLCKSKGVCCALDNTWGAGLAFQPFDLMGNGSFSLGVDVSVHALTKYPSGGGDVLMGSIVTRDPSLGMKLKLCHMRLGLGVAANDTETVLRSLASMPLRYRQHDATARALAHWSTRQNRICSGLAPSAAGFTRPCPLAKPVLQRGWRGWAAGLWSVVIDPRYTQAQVDAFCDGLQLFKIGYSWGGPVSLVVPYDLSAMRSVWPAHLQHGTVVRFSSGLEDADDLQADLTQALNMHLPPLPA